MTRSAILRTATALWLLAAALVGTARGTEAAGEVPGTRPSAGSPRSTGAAAGATSAFTPLTPVRAVDTRTGLGGVAGPLAPGAVVEFALAGTNGIAAGATAVAVTVTIVDAAQGGYATAFPPDQPPPPTSTVNVSSAGETRANFALVALSTDGRLGMVAAAGGHLLLDVSGYWSTATSATAGRYQPIEPQRVLDTRPSGYESFDVPVPIAGRSGIPADAAAVAITLTATRPLGWTFVTAWPAGTPRPEVSNLNVTSTLDTIPNLAIVPLGAQGGITLHTAVPTHLIVDVVGWFTGPSAAPAADGLFVPITPARLADSREASGLERLAPGLFDEVAVAGRGGVPASGVGSVAVNLTATAAESTTYVVAYAGRTARPWASNLNIDPGRDAASAAFSRVGSNGAVAVSSARSTELVVDVTGWFTGSAAPTTDPQPPRRCSNLMAYLHNTDPVRGSNEVRIRDLSGATPEIVVAPQLDAHAVRLAPNCDFLLIGVPAAAAPGRYDVALVRDFTSPEARVEPIIGNYPWHGLAVSADSRWVYFYTASDRTADYVGAYDTKLHETRFATGSGPPLTLGMIAHAEDDRLLVSRLVDGTRSLQWCSLTSGPAAGSWCAPFPWPDGGASDAAVSPDRSFPHAAVGIPGRGVAFSGPFGLVPLDEGGALPRFTWQGEPVVWNFTDHHGIWRYGRLPGEACSQPACRTLLLDAVVDHSPAFSRPWSPVRSALFGTGAAAPSDVVGTAPAAASTAPGPSDAPGGEPAPGAFDLIAG